MSGLYFASTRFAKYRPNFEQFVSEIVQHPVEVREITIGSHGLEPVLRLHHVVIFNANKTKALLKAEELQVGIDLIGSLLKWQFKPDLLVISGSELEILQDEFGKINVVGISPVSSFSPAGKDHTVFDEVSSWLFEQNRVDLKDITLKLTMPHGKVLQFSKLYAKLYNGIFWHELKLGGKLKQQQQPASFAVDLKLRGEVSPDTGFPLHGSIVIENWEPDHVATTENSLGKFFIPSGNLEVAVKNSKIPLKFLRQPLTVNDMFCGISWQRDSSGNLKVNLNKIKFMDNWLMFFGAGELQFLEHTKAPVVDVHLGVKLTNLAKAKLYYPANLMPPNGVKWLDQAFISSKLISGDIVLQGPLDKFPFDNNEGKFLVDATIRDVCLNYDPEWPRVENITGKMFFSGRTMTILAHNAKLMRAPTKYIKAEIPDLVLPIIHIDGAMDGDSSIGVKFVNACPLKKTIGKKLQDISLTGPMKFKLKFVMPLSDVLLDQTTKVDGSIELINNRLRLDAWGVGIDNFTGNLQFDRDSFVAHKLQGKLLNKPVNIDISTVTASKKDTITRVDLAGNASVQDFERIFALKLAPFVSGDFSYKVLLDLHSGATQDVFKLHSNLHGVEIKLPEPFAKKAADPHIFHVSGSFGEDKQKQQIFVNYNGEISAALAVKKDGVKPLKVLGGELRFGDGSAKVSSLAGLAITGHLPKVDWSIWKGYLDQAGNLANTGSLVSQINLKIAELLALGQVFKQASLKAQPKDRGWEVEFLTADIDGKIYLPLASNEVIKGDFKKLRFSEGNQKMSGLKPQDLPPLNLKIGNLHYGSKQFNNVVFVSERQARGIKVNKVNFSGPRFSVSGSGDWLVAEKQQNSVFQGKISSNDVGGLLKQWDLTSSMLGGNGEANFVLRWPDSPLNLTLSTVSGNVALSINQGRIINLSRQAESKLGFGRVLNMLSLQALPRRLTLDFSDVIQQGLIFDTMVGDCELTDGNAIIKKFKIEGELAHVTATGVLGLKTQTYDINLNVMPHISTTLPITATAAILGGPVGGMVGLIADNLLSPVTKKVTRKAVNYNYRVAGSWEEPNISIVK